MQRSKCMFVTIFARYTVKLSVACGREWDYSTLCGAELTGLSSFQKLRKTPSIHHWSKFCIWNMFRVYISSFVGGGPNFSEGVHICSKISSRGSLFIEKLVPGGTNFGESILTMTDLPGWSGDGSWSIVDGWILTCEATGSALLNGFPCLHLRSCAGDKVIR